MKLYDPVIKKIEELGPTKAAAYFEKSAPTIHAWRKSPEKIPLAAVQMVLDQSQTVEEPSPETAPLPAQVVPTPQVIGGNRDVPRVISAQDISNHIITTEKRLDKLEDFARLMTDPDLHRTGTSLLRPATPPQSTQPAAAVVNPAITLSPPETENDPSPKLSNLLKPRTVPA